MRKSLYKWAGCAIFILVISVAGIRTMTSNPSQFPIEISLSDGTRFRVLQMEYGTQIYLTNLTAWKRVLLRLPAKIRPSGIVTPPIFKTTNPSLIMLYEEIRTNRFHGNLYFDLVDENGIRNPIDWSFRDRVSGIPRAYSFSNFPRRSKTFKLLLHTIDESGHAQIPNKTALVGQITIRNDFQTKVEPWLNNSLPMQKTASNLTVQLRDVAWNADFDRENCLTNIDREGNQLVKEHPLLLKMQLKEYDRVTGDWRIFSVTTDDASGNDLGAQCAHGGSFTKNGLYQVSLDESLWPGEPTRYRIECGRIRHFPSNEVWTVPDLPVPAKDQFTRVGISTNLNGERIIIEGIAGMNSRPPWAQKRTGDSLEVMFSNSMDLSFPGMTNGVHLIVVSVVDDKGRDCTPMPDDSDVRYGSLGSGQTQSHNICFFKDSKSVTIKLAISKSEWLDFTTQPRIFSTNDFSRSSPAMKGMN
ncbi:MAG: hypothetical protein JWM04_1419 [Verrucomicrobiales bacterium]|nr:hypothetical protein [Verrucomicrobiales bacterium]